MSLLLLLSAGAKVEFTPDPAIAKTGAPDPVVILGGVTIVPPPAIAKTGAPDPVVILGALIIEPPPAIARCHAKLTLPTTINFHKPKLMLLNQKKRIKSLKQNKKIKR